jgi:hypothetical protein
MLVGCESMSQGPAPNPAMTQFSSDWAECQRENQAQDEKVETVTTNKAKECMRAKGYADANKK